MTSGLLPRSEPYTRRLEAILLLFIVTYAIKVHIHGFCSYDDETVFVSIQRCPIDLNFDVLEYYVSFRLSLGFPVETEPDAFSFAVV